MSTDSNRFYSIIVPVYNAEKTLRRCIDSILSQSYTNFELILVDDGSNDESGVIIDEYAVQDLRIKPLHQPNGGVSSARNTGIDNANGEYIIFIDSDDEILHNHIAEFENSNSDCIISGLIINREKDMIIDEPSNNETISKHQFANLLNKYSKTLFFRGPYVKAFRRDIIENKKLRFNEQLHWSEDYIFVINYLQFCNTVSLIKNASYIYYYPTTIGKYTLTSDKYHLGLKIDLNILRELGASHTVINLDKSIYFYTFLSYLHTRPFIDRLLNYFKVFINGTTFLIPASTPLDYIKKHIELLRVVIFSK